MPERVVREVIKPSQMFHYSQPWEPITREGFVGAFWGDVLPQPIEILSVQGQMQKVEVFGFQALRNIDSTAGMIEMHPEPKQTELTIAIQGRGNMTIQTPQGTEIHPMTGPVPSGVDLRDAMFELSETGELTIYVNERVYISHPVITPVGSSHSTQLIADESEESAKPAADEFVYLAVKVVQEMQYNDQANMLAQIHRDVIM